MSTLQLRIVRQRLRLKARRQRAERRGSTLLIVLVMLTMLTSLGVIFYVFAAQERTSANNYSDGAKVKQFDIDRDTLFDFGIRQMMEGPQPGTFRNSALSGRRHALLPNMLGLDTSGRKLDYSPFNGTVLTSTDSVNGVNRYSRINDSAAANNGADPDFVNLLNNLDPDYTYPDNNNVFLSYQGYDPVFGQRIIIPSFHRPQSPTLRGNFGSNLVPRNQVLRPHEDHIWVPPANQQPPNPAVSRYLTAAQIAGLGGTWTGWGTFPFRPDWDGDSTAGEQGVWSLSTPYTSGTTLPDYEYDVDNDRDALRTKEGVWLDLDFPPLENSAGLLYVPFFSATIIDADGLLNLNAHGNMARVWNGDVALNASPFRGTDGSNINDKMISKSNQGLYPSEVNPLWALNRRAPVAGSSFTYEGAYAADPFFGNYVGNGVPENWMEAANRDWLYLLMGRYTQSPVDLVPGRWGEEHLLFRAISNGSSLTPRYFATDGSNVLADPWPGPGQTQIDDNGDTNKVTGDWFGSAYQPFGKPLDYTGLGSYWQSTNPKLGNYLTSGTGPAQWPIFMKYSSVNGGSQVRWPNPFAVPDTRAYLLNGLFNDAGEVVLDPDFKKDEDNSFGPEEMRALFLNQDDFGFTTGGDSRITQLAPYNFDLSAFNYGSRSGQEFRSKFTTRSWDRKQHSIGYNATRAWEFNADADRDSQPNYPKTEFPPVFAPGSILPYSTLDVFRPVLRQLIEVERNNFDQPRYQLRLNLNQLLVGPNGNPLPSLPNQRPPNIQLQYRPLTPHPDQTTLAATPITAVSYPANGNFTNANDQEYWARRDRQLMARDIFGLLYVMAWPDGIDPITLPAADRQNYRPMIRQFAQYAANLVDAIDRDNIVTRFEFDVDLYNGWQVDDDPFTISDGSGDRFEVYGAERLGLTLSEAAAVRCDENMTENVSYTQWDDMVMDGQHFSYVELQNPGPDSVSFTNRAWRVEVGPNYSSMTAVPMGAETTVRRLNLRAGSVTEGATFTIGSTDHTVGGMNPSIMKVGTGGSAPADWDTDQTTWIFPAQQPLDLDLQNSAQSTNYSLTDASGNAVPSSALYDHLLHQQIASTTTPLYFRLYRRLSPDRPFPNTTAEEDDNPFVLVDEIALTSSHVTTISPITAATPTSDPAGRVSFASSDLSSDIVNKLSNIRSRERAQPFSAISSDGYAFHTSTGAYGNTLSATNGNSPAAFTNWQKVYDRDLASPGEMLHVTVGGFSNITLLRGNTISSSRAPLPGMATGFTVDGTTNRYMTLDSDTAGATVSMGTIPSDAEALFRPFVTPNGAAATTATPRWHRFLEIVEVATKMQATIPGLPHPVDYARVPGKVNLNTARHTEVLAGLIDDPSVMTFRVDEDTNGNGSWDPGEDDGDNNLEIFTPPKLQRRDNTGSTDDWWLSLVGSRDGGRNAARLATTDATSGLLLPGTPESKPFRSFGQALGTAANDYTGVEQTLLRSWPLDAYPNAANGSERPRQLFELGTPAEHQGAGVTPLDPYVRSRILNKIANNVTTRSNVFVVFMSVKFFRANRDATTGAVQIGGPLMDPSLGVARWEPEYRRFFVIDRSQIEKAFDPQTGGFNFRALIEFQQDLQ